MFPAGGGKESYYKEIREVKYLEESASFSNLHKGSEGLAVALMAWIWRRTKLGARKPFRQPLQLSGLDEKKVLTRVMAISLEKTGKGVRD